MEEITKRVAWKVVVNEVEMLGCFEYAMAFDDVGMVEPFEGGD